MADRKIIVLTAPSGAGKTTIAHRLLDAIPHLQFSVSATTRPPRENEVHGEDYFFLSEEQFEQRLDEGDLLEFEEVYPGRYYGTLRSEVRRKSEEGPVLLDIDVKGALNVKKAFGEEAFALFIAPPSADELRRRLRKRGTEDPSSLQQRIERASLEMEAADRFDAVVVNDDLEPAVEETLRKVRQFLSE
jgi:guanylate kinase